MGSNTGVLVHKIKLEADRPLCRALQLETMETESSDEAVIQFPFSSEAPARQYFGTEILCHDPTCVDLTRLNDGSAPFLWNHDRDQVLGINLRGWIKDRRCYAEAKFDLGDMSAAKYHRKVKEGFLRNVSTHYLIDVDSVEEMYDEESKEFYYKIHHWTPVETSLVSIPADSTVGIGRSLNNNQIIWTPSFPQSQDTLEAKDNGTRTMTATPVVKTDDQIQEALKAAQREERDRISGLRGLQEDYGDRHPAIKKKIDEAISEGWTIDTCRNAITELALGDGQQRPPVSGHVSRQLGEDEQKDYSIFRIMRAAAEGKNFDEIKKLAPFEHEISQRIGNELNRSTTGFYVPIADLMVPKASRSMRVLPASAQRATFSAGTATAGGNLIDTELDGSMFLDFLFNRSVTANMGATRITGLRGNYEFPVEDASSLGISWLGEEDPAPETTLTFTKKALVPHHAGAFMDVTRQQMLQSEVAMEPLMRSRLAIAMSLGVDAAALFGSGVGNEPQGILNTPGIGSVALGTDGAAPTFDSIVRLETEINQDNADLGEMGYVTNAKAVGTLKVTGAVPTTSTGDFSATDMVWTTQNGRQGMMNGYRAMMSNQIPSNLTKGTGTNLSAIIFGHWPQLYIGQWGVAEIMVNPYGEADFLRGRFKVRTLFTLDIQVAYEQAFAAITDAITLT